MSITVERLASLIQRELAPIVNSVVQKEVIGYINLTEVKLTKDLSIAKIYYTILSDNEETLDYTQKELKTFVKFQKLNLYMMKH